MSTIESLPFEFFTINQDGCYAIQNSYCKKIWGDITGKRPQDLPVSKEILDEWLDANRRVFAGEVVRKEFELPVKGKTGTFFNIMAPIKNEDQVLGLLGVNIDITERKRAERELRKSEADFQMLAKIGADVVGGKDIEESLQRFTVSLRELMDADRGWLFELGEDKGTAKYVSWKEGWEPATCTVKYDSPDDINRYVVETVRSNPGIVHVFDYLDEPIRGMDDPATRSLLIKSQMLYLFTSYSGKKWVCGVHENTREHRAWTEHEKLLLKQASYFANLAISGKESRDALETSEEKIRGITNTASDAIVVIDEEGKITFWNPAAEKTFGYSAAEVIGKELHLFLAPKSFYQAYRKGFHEFRNTGKGPAIGKTMEFQAVKKDGTVFPIEVSTSAIKINNKWHSTGIIRDITERKVAEGRQAGNLHYFMSMHQISEIIEQTMEVEKMIQEVVEKLLTIFSCDRAWLLYPCDPDSPTWKVPVAAAVPEYPNPVPANVEMPMDPVMAETSRKILATNKPVSFSPETTPLLLSEEYEPQKKLKIKSALAVAIHTKVGQPWELGLHQCSHEREWTEEEKRLFHDISYKLSDAISNMLLYQDLQQSETALQAAKDELERQNQELKALDKMKDGLIRDATHELKTPVAKQGMQLEILKRILDKEGLSDACAKVINTMESSIQRQDSVINNILDLSRLEAGGRKFRSEPMRLDMVLNSVIEDYQTTLEAHNIKINKVLPEITIDSDREMLFHVFSNLINNAIKYRGSVHQPEINISLEAGGEKVAIKVSDNGIGMTEDALAHAFDKFYQASASAEGSGVGLSIVKMITEGLGGRVWLESAGIDQGVTAVVEFPVKT